MKPVTAATGSETSIPHISAMRAIPMGSVVAAYATCAGVSVSASVYSARRMHVQDTWKERVRLKPELRREEKGNGTENEAGSGERGTGNEV